MVEGLYDEARAAQVVAYLLHRAGGSLELLKLTKLLYLAERLSVERFGEPLTGDKPYSLQHGPILSTTYDRTKVRQKPAGVWAESIKERAGNVIAEARPLTAPRDELRKLSRADFKLLDDTWGRFGAMTAGELVDWTHRHCPEWTTQDRSSSPISLAALLKSLGIHGDEAKATLQRWTDTAAIKQSLRTAR